MQPIDAAVTLVLEDGLTDILTDFIEGIDRFRKGTVCLDRTGGDTVRLREPLTGALR